MNHRVHLVLLLAVLLGLTLSPRTSGVRALDFSYKEGDISWCNVPDCTTPKQGLLNVLKAYHVSDKATNAVCGDGVCNASGKENCLNCPKDCGACKVKTEDAITTGCVDKSIASITFDDGPSDVTQGLVALLDELGVKATFYVNAYRIANLTSSNKKWLRGLQAAYASNHTIGTHTFTHTGMVYGTTGNNKAKYLEWNRFLMEMQFNDLVVASAIGKVPRYFRPPYLEINMTMSAHLEALGYNVQLINVDTKDFDMHQLGSNVITSNFQNALDAYLMTNRSVGVITLQHDLFKESALAVSDIVAMIRKKGIKIVPMHECLGLPADSQYLTGKYNIPAELMVTPDSVPDASWSNLTNSGSRATLTWAVAIIAVIALAFGTLI
ncbi:hypothetical protein H9P43_000870 [Blastocladiella emersonii ATCC 22665]|nr:hypothetical protein H9P43_000870 [Blastocladiella emersonii ATCC 22665]